MKYHYYCLILYNQISRLLFISNNIVLYFCFCIFFSLLYRNFQSYEKKKRFPSTDMFRSRPKIFVRIEYIYAFKSLIFKKNKKVRYLKREIIKLIKDAECSIRKVKNH